MKIDEQGWLIEAERRLTSPFYDERPSAAIIDTCVLHGITLPANKFGTRYIDALFTGRLPSLEKARFFPALPAATGEPRVCAHFLIARDGAISQYVATIHRAWHAGASYFDGKSACNDFSVGIELNGSDHHPYTLKQYQVCAKLVNALMLRHPAITPKRVTTHSHIAPTRKTDPGPAFHLPFFFSLLKR